MHTDYESDEVIQEVQDQMYRREEKRPKDPFSRLDNRTKFWVGLTAAAIAVGMYTHRLGEHSVRTGLFLLAVGFGLLWLLKSSDPARGELTYIECMIRIQDLLKLLQRHPVGDVPQIPPGRIHIKPIGRKQWIEGGITKRSFGVDIYDSVKNLTEMYFVEVDTLTGDIITFREAPEGVYGDETKDIKFMPSYDMLMHRRADRYLGRTPRGGR